MSLLHDAEAPDDERVVTGPWVRRPRPIPLRYDLAQHSMAVPAWVQPWSVLLLSCALLWLLFGNTEGDPKDITETAAVNPYNSIVWLGLLAASAPVMRTCWRDIAILLRANWMLLALFAYFALSVGWALDPPAAMRRVLSALVQVGLLATLLCGIRRAPVLHVVLAAIFIFAGVANFAAWPLMPDAWPADGFIGVQGQKNQTGLTVMYGCLAVATCLPYARHWFWRTTLVLSLLLLFAVLIMTRSSTSQSVVIAAALLMPLLLAISKLPRRSIVAIAAGAVLGLVTLLFGYLAWCALKGVDALGIFDGMTFTNRLGIWTFVVEEIGKRPWFGTGYSSFWGIDPVLQPSLHTDEWFSVDEIITEGHQGYLDLLATTGVFGFLGSMLVICRAIGQAGMTLNRTKPPLLAWHEGVLGRPTAIFHLTFLLGYLLHNFTESGFFGSGSPLTVLLVIAMLDLEKWHLQRSMGTQPLGTAGMQSASWG